MSPYYRYNRKRTVWDKIDDNFGVITGISAFLLVAVIVVAVFWATNAWVSTKHSYANCLVSGKESINKDKTHEYRVYTENCGVFTVSDEMWLGKFNAADTYSQIKQDKTYSFETVGWRNSFFSTFENIVEVR